MYMYMCGLYGIEDTTKAVVVWRVEVKQALPQIEPTMERCKYIIYVCNSIYVCMCICMNIQYMTLLNLDTITVLPLTAVSGTLYFECSLT